MKLKKISFAILVASGLLALASCGGSKSNDSNNSSDTGTTEPSTDPSQGDPSQYEEPFTTSQITSNGVILTKYVSKRDGKIYYKVNVGTDESKYFYFGITQVAPTKTKEGKISVDAYAFDEKKFTFIDNCEEVIPTLENGEYYDFDSTKTENNYVLDLSSLPNEYEYHSVIQNWLMHVYQVTETAANKLAYKVMPELMALTYTVAESDITYPIEIYNAITDEDLYTDRISRGTTVTLADVKAIVEATDYYKENQPDLLYYVEDVLITDDDYEFDTTSGVYIQVDEDDSEPVDVTLNFNGLSVESITKSTKGKYTIEDFRSKVTNKVILGWSEDPDAYFPDYEIGDVFEYDEDTILYCIYRDLFAISYDLNGGTGSMTDGISDNMGDAIIANIPSTSTNGSLVFAGWSQDEDSTEVEYRPGDKINLDDDFFLYAVWVEAYKVSYDLNGAEGEVNYSVSDEDGIAELAYLPDEITYDHHHFLGWATEATATEPEYEEGDFVEIDKDVTLYAIWAEDNKVTVIYNYMAEPQTYSFYGNEEGLAELALYSYPTRQGYRCLGYANSTTATEAQYERWDKVDVSEGNVILYPVFVKIYNVKFYNEKEGYNRITTKTYDEGELVSLQNEFEKANYTFDHWEDKSGNVYAEFDEVEITSDLEFYCFWDGNEITVYYYDPFYPEEPFDYYYEYYGESFTTKGTSDFEFDYELIGWTTKPYDPENEIAEIDFDLDTEYYVDDVANGESLALYACFKDMSYTFTDIVEEATLEHNGKITHKCNEDDTLTTIETISNEDIFAMQVDGCITATGVGIVLTGKVMHGTIHVGETVSLNLKTGEIINVPVIGIQMYRKDYESASKGDVISLVFAEDAFARIDITSGSSSSTPAHSTMVTSEGKLIMADQMLVDLYLKTYDEGGRSTAVSVGTFRPSYKMAYNADETTYTGYIGGGTFASAYDYNNNNASLTSLEPGSHSLVKIEFTTAGTFPVFIGETVNVFDGTRYIGVGQVVARTDEQISELVNNCARITFNDSIGASGSEKVLFVNKNTELSDIELMFKRNGYTFYGYTTTKGKTYDQINKTERENMLKSTANSFKNQTLYLVWEPVNKERFDFYITDFYFTSPKHGEDYSTLISDTPLARDLHKGDTITIKYQNGETVTTTIRTLAGADYTEVETAVAGLSGIRINVSDNVCANMQYGDVIVLN